MAQPQVALTFEDGITRFISIEEDQTIIDAAYKARINIPFDCRDGACGTCKAFCESGEYDEGDYIDEAMTEDEAEEGYILCCQTYPVDDMVVQVPITSAAAKTGASTLIGTIVELNRLSESTVKFAVKLEEREKLDYLPGQYMNIAPPNADFHRSYSFSSGPSDDVVTFLVKYTPGGKMTTYLTERAQVGDTLNLTGPMGSFFLREPSKPILLLAGGTGLAPILAILERLAELPEFTQPVRLIYGATYNHDIVEIDKLNSFQEKLADFEWFSVLSAKDEEHERKGYVTDHIDVQKHLHDGDADVYLCGPPPMVEAVRTHLNQLDTPPANFYYEKFTPQGGNEGNERKVAPTAETTEAEGSFPPGPTVSREVTDTARQLSVVDEQVESGEIHTAVSAAQATFEALSALEVGAAALVINLLDEEDFTEMTTLAQETNKHLSGNELTDAASYIAANTRFHEFLFRRSGNEAMLRAFQELNTAKVMSADLKDGSAVADGIATDHLGFIEALRNKDLVAVREVVNRHTEKAVAAMTSAIADDSAQSPAKEE
ncbi:benzoate 1,2-dioxygenase electron transfer component BenC [Corynebacterium tapiri]|uniref:2Fe-2S iron-sulfur cluster binding domain-containing protein n=1 Tax=Corynebacterium tapiri TaxID=1448266 RepID=A0A5C4U3J9_9CORY|nr:benzoate 1,2-dioxygenase electron transfer component BenC [Corynebacterium tapiri]TNL96675.1 2Fe-2S iron-sulfur cluster binding domain-containing protein [Corynebacterium tapiri]